jgi:hypothetical protein
VKDVSMARFQKGFIETIFSFAAVFFLLGISWRGFAQPTAEMQLPPAGADSIVAVSPYVDTHAHFDAKTLSDPNGEVDAALREMGQENAAKLVFLPASGGRSARKTLCAFSHSQKTSEQTSLRLV